MLFCLLTTRCGGNKVSYGVCNHCVQAMFEAFCDSVLLCAEKKFTYSNPLPIAGLWNLLGLCGGVDFELSALLFC